MLQRVRLGVFRRPAHCMAKDDPHAQMEMCADKCRSHVPCHGLPYSACLWEVTVHMCQGEKGQCLPMSNSPTRQSTSQKTLMLLLGLMGICEVEVPAGKVRREPENDNGSPLEGSGAQLATQDALCGCHRIRTKWEKSSLRVRMYFAENTRACAPSGKSPL